MNYASFQPMDEIRDTVFQTIRARPGLVKQLFRAKLPHDGDAAAHALTDEVMRQLNGYESTRKPITAGWYVDVSDVK